MWRSGTALAAVLQLPGSRYAEALAGLDMRPLSWLALLVEPFFALLPWLPAGRPRRWLLGLWLAFHGLLILSFDVAVANLTRQQAFFAAHVQPWVLRMCDALQAHPKARFYAAVAGLTRAFVAVEAQGFDMLENQA